MDQDALLQMQEQLDKVKSKVDKWAESEVSALDSMRTSHKTAMKELQENVENLKKEEETAAQEADKASKLSATQEKELESARDGLGKIRAQCATLPDKAAALASEVETERTAIAKSEAAISEADKAKVQRMKELAKGITFYKERLGLEFERIGDDDSLRLTFTKVDARDPDRAFSFDVAVNSENQYQLLNCLPRVEGVEALVKRANEDNNFSRLVVSMRQLFRNKASQGE